MSSVRVPVCCAKANSRELSRVWPVVAVADRSVIFIMSFGLDLTLWHQLANVPAASPELIKQGDEVTAKLNALLAASGHPDVRL